MRLLFKPRHDLRRKTGPLVVSVTYFMNNEGLVREQVQQGAASPDKDAKFQMLCVRLYVLGGDPVMDSVIKCFSACTSIKDRTAAVSRGGNNFSVQFSSKNHSH